MDVNITLSSDNKIYINVSNTIENIWLNIKNLHFDLIYNCNITLKDNINYWFQPDNKSYLDGFYLEFIQNDVIIYKYCSEKIVYKPKEIFLINAYTETIEKIDELRNLIQTIKKNNYEICLVTHTSTPQDIIDRCDYFIYDKQNPLLYDPHLQYWIWYKSDIFNIFFKSFKSKIHFLPYYRSMFGSLHYLKTFGYDVVHSFDYDIKFNNFDVISENIELLKKYDIVGYINTNGDRFCHYTVKLNEIDIEKMIYDQDTLIKLYDHYMQNEKFPAVEMLLWDEYLPKNLFIRNVAELEKSALVALRSFGENDVAYDIMLFPYDNNLYMYVTNPDSSFLNVDIIYKNQVKNFIIDPHRTYYQYIDILDIESGVKIYANDKLFTNQINLDYFFKNVRFEKK